LHPAIFVDFWGDCLVWLLETRVSPLRFWRLVLLMGWFPRLTRRRCFLKRWFSPLTGERTFFCFAKRK